MNYEISFHIKAKSELEGLDGRERILVLKQLKKLSNNPYFGEELGNKAGMNLTGYRKIYVDKKKIRIVYKIIEDKILIYVISIGKRDRMDDYKKSETRM